MLNDIVIIFFVQSSLDSQDHFNFVRGLSKRYKNLCLTFNIIALKNKFCSKLTIRIGF